MTIGITGRRADGPVAGGGGPAAGQSVQLLLTRLGDEVAAIDHGKPVPLQERNVRVDDEDVVGVFHHGAGERDRVPGVLGCGHRTGLPGPGHHRCVQLRLRRRGEGGPAAGVEQWIVLEYGHGGTDGVQGPAARGQHLPSGLVGGPQPLLVGRAGGQGQLLQAATGPAVQGQARSRFGRRHFEDLHSDRSISLPDDGSLRDGGAQLAAAQLAGVAACPPARCSQRRTLAS